jgi:hypothetical protein
MYKGDTHTLEYSYCFVGIIAKIYSLFRLMAKYEYEYGKPGCRNCFD